MVNLDVFFELEYDDADTVLCVVHREEDAGVEVLVMMVEENVVLDVLVFLVTVVV